MATALDVISRALRLIGSLDGGGVPTADQAQEGLISLQAMLGEWETRGVRLGSAVDATYLAASTVPVPITHLQAMAFNLAVVIAPEYGRGDQLQALIPQAERSFDALAAQYCIVPVVGVDPALSQMSALINSSGAVGWGYNSAGGGGDPDGALYGDDGPLYP